DADLSEPKLGEMGDPKTNRELFEQRIEPAECNGCHAHFDTIGYGLENYDAVGGFRTTDNGFPVDAEGTLKGTDVDGAFVGGIELSHRIAESRMARGCMAENWFQYGAGRETREDDLCRLGKMNLALDDTGGDVREMLVSLVASPEFVYRPVPIP